MKLYRDSNNNIYAYEEDGSQDHLIGDKTSVTAEEAEQLIGAQEAADFASLDYAEKRRLRYPSIGEQLDALYHAGVFPPEMAAKIQAVKDQFPKS